MPAYAGPRFPDESPRVGALGPICGGAFGAYLGPIWGPFFGGPFGLILTYVGAILVHLGSSLIYLGPGTHLGLAGWPIWAYSIWL